MYSPKHGYTTELGHKRMKSALIKKARGEALEHKKEGMKPKDGYSATRIKKYEVGHKD